MGQDVLSVTQGRRVFIGASRTKFLNMKTQRPSFNSRFVSIPKVILDVLFALSITLTKSLGLPFGSPVPFRRDFFETENGRFQTAQSIGPALLTQLW